MSPTEPRGVHHQLGRTAQSIMLSLRDGVSEMLGVPVDDGGEQVHACHAEVLCGPCVALLACSLAAASSDSGRMTKVTRIRGPIRTYPSALMKAVRRPSHKTLDGQTKSGDLTAI